MILIIGILGKAQAGKSTISKLILDKFSLEYPSLKTFILPMAKPIKDYVQNELGYNKTDFPKEYRENCQRIGAEKRKEDKDHWVKIWEKEVFKIIKENNNNVAICVDDVRYENEISYMKSLNSEFLFVYENGKRTNNKKEGNFRDHESEILANLISLCYDKAYDKKEAMKFLFKSYKMENCQLINNSGTLEALDEEISRIVNNWHNISLETSY